MALGGRTAVDMRKIAWRSEIGAWRLHGGRGMSTRYGTRYEWRGIIRCRRVIWILPRSAGLLSPRWGVVVWRRWRNDGWCDRFRGGEGGYEGCGRWLWRKVVEHFGQVSVV